MGISAGDTQQLDRGVSEVELRILQPYQLFFPQLFIQGVIFRPVDLIPATFVG